MIYPWGLGKCILAIHAYLPNYPSEYGIDDLLVAGADLLCPTVPAGQECHLPLHPGNYGGHIQFTFPQINPIIGDLLAAGDYKVDATFLLDDGTEFTCLTFTLELTGSEA